VRTLIVALAVVAVGCGGKSQSEYCVPGQTAACELAGCAAGGVQVCKDDWSGYGECTCSAQSDAGSPRDGAQKDGLVADAAGPDGPRPDGSHQGGHDGGADATGDGLHPADAADAAGPRDALVGDGGLACPTAGSLPVVLPYADVVLDGAAFYAGATQSWTWQVTGGPCDQLFVASAGKPGFTLNGVQTTTATTSAVTFRAPLSGDYRVAVAVVTTAGQTLSCDFVVPVRGPGLRVELCWDTTGDSDLDLHLHRPGTTTPWFVLPASDGGVSSTNDDDCHYVNCRASDFYPSVVGAAWGYGTNDWSPLANCQNTADGATWIQAGQCHNPRLDADNISTVAMAENVNVDLPRHDDTYRVMVHYYTAAVSPIPAAHPMVNIWCGGYLQATYGAAPDVVPGFDQTSPPHDGSMWRVADVTTWVDASGTTTGCTVAPLHPPGQSSGYWVTLDDTSY
jgi:hypothetical protein